MSIREKSVLKKAVLEYESPDGDIWEITIADSGGDRAYVQCQQVGIKQKNDEDKEEVVQVDKEIFTIDCDMLLEVGDAYRQMTGKSPVAFSGVDRRFLHSPQIIDHRGLEQSNDIQQQVDKTMANHDDNIEPVQSFSPVPGTGAVVQDFTHFRSGVAPESAAEAPPETPERWKMDQTQQGLSEWQKDAKLRQTVSRPMAPGRVGGHDRPKFKRDLPAAEDII